MIMNSDEIFCITALVTLILLVTILALYKLFSLWRSQHSADIRDSEVARRFDDIQNETEKNNKVIEKRKFDRLAIETEDKQKKELTTRKEPESEGETLINGLIKSESSPEIEANSSDETTSQTFIGKGPDDRQTPSPIRLDFIREREIDSSVTGEDQNF